MHSPEAQARSRTEPSLVSYDHKTLLFPRTDHPIAQVLFTAVPFTLALKKNYMLKDKKKPSWKIQSKHQYQIQIWREWRDYQTTYLKHGMMNVLKGSTR